jgi:hypothetical protein
MGLDSDEGKGSDDDDEEEEEEEQEQENQGYGRGHRPRRAFDPFGSQFTDGSHDSQDEQPGRGRGRGRDRGRGRGRGRGGATALGTHMSDDSDDSGNDGEPMPQRGCPPEQEAYWVGQTGAAKEFRRNARAYNSHTRPMHTHPRY